MFRRWFRSKCIDRRVLGALIGASLILPAHAAPARKPLPKLLVEVEQKYSKAATLQAGFEQVTESAALGEKKTSSGVIMLKRPNKLRWETLKPDKNLLVSDGRTFWFYTPPFEEGEHGQVIEKKTSEVQSRLANALLAGNFSVISGMRIIQDSPSQFTLIPKPKTAGTVKIAEITVDPEKKLIKKVILEHTDGNKTEITLSKIELGEKMSDQFFTFIVPPNTERLKE